jgi:hypothetical protein
MPLHPGGMTGYFWYNGSTSFVDGEKLKWRTWKQSESETDEESEPIWVIHTSHNKDTKRSELFMTRLKEKSNFLEGRTSVRCKDLG